MRTRHVCTYINSNVSAPDQGLGIEAPRGRKMKCWSRSWKQGMFTSLYINYSK